MQPDTKTKLIEQRFIIGEQTLSVFKSLQKTMVELKKEYPYLAGIGFFGSQTKGLQRSDSDFDIIIFYKAERMSEDSGRLDEWETIVNRLEDSIQEKEESIRKKIDFRVRIPNGGLKVNIDERNIDRYFRDLTEALIGVSYKHTSSDVAALKYLLSIPTVQNLLSPFLFSIGDDVYQARQYIISKFEHIPNGDSYFSFLMGCLNLFERTHSEKEKSSPQYVRLPNTTAEAKKFFINKRKTKAL